jgi:hypothetical protein
MEIISYYYSFYFKKLLQPIPQGKSSHDKLSLFFVLAGNNTVANNYFFSCSIILKGFSFFFIVVVK